MGIFRLRRAGIGVFAALILLSAVPAEPHTPQHPPGGKLLRFRLPFEAQTLDWNQGEVPVIVIQNVMRGLYRVDENGKVQPDLVQEASSRDKGRTWTFELKPGIAWSDGEPLQARHFAESFRRLLAPSTASSYAYFLFDIRGAKAFNRDGKTELGIHVTGDRKLEIELERPLPYFPAVLTHWVTYPIRPDLIAKWPDHWTNPEHQAFLGPFRIVELRQQLRIVLAQNPKAEKKPWLERIEGWMIPEDNTALNLYDSGHFELITDPGLGAANHPDLTYRESPILYFIGLSKSHPLTRTRAGILALSAALRRSELPKALGAPHRPTLGLFPPELWTGLGGSEGDFPRSDIPLDGSNELAHKLLKEAGISSPGTLPLLTLHYFNRPMVRELAQWIQAQWKRALGIPVRLESADPKSYWSGLARRAPAAFLNSKGEHYPDPDTFFRWLMSGSPQNYGGWTDADFDSWVVSAAESSSPSDRRALYAKAAKRALTENPAVIPLFFRSTGYLIKPFLKGVSINPLSGIDLSAAHYDDF